MHCSIRTTLMRELWSDMISLDWMTSFKKVLGALLSCFCLNVNERMQLKESKSRFKTAVCLRLGEKIDPRILFVHRRPCCGDRWRLSYFHKQQIHSESLVANRWIEKICIEKNLILYEDISPCVTIDKLEISELNKFSINMGDVLSL